MSAKRSEPKNTPLTAEAVRNFLVKNPEFITQNMELIVDSAVPERDLGEGVVDFQRYMVKNLQKDSQQIKDRYDVLVDFCRDNMSAQTQVHQAALALMKIHSLEQLLEAITQDLLRIFDVDVVRLAMESDVPFDTSYGEQHYSGIVFIEPGMVDVVFDRGKPVCLISDCNETPPPGFEQIFADCDSMIASCALLRLELETIGKHILLAFGVRHKDRFHPGQGVELLRFLAQIVALQMDKYLEEMAI